MKSAGGVDSQTFFPLKIKVNVAHCISKMFFSPVDFWVYFTPAELAR